MLKLEPRETSRSTRLVRSFAVTKVISTNEIAEKSTFQVRFYVETYNGYNYRKCMSSCFLFQCYPVVDLTMNDYFHVYVLEFQTFFPLRFQNMDMLRCCMRLKEC